ncbi:IclR family transcriptional regulator [Tamaricihabitans halophyticus]|uniref:IclR family transcriptional regulator n=1 Tax=Tamaricihabitans halophyticus TaxID=1262583 RepID=A0A4R2QSI5_9PSEU|nr:IclR family transcriptional regulator [Tamaricihabitans halophyticus]TCP52094.1 IclR family transcriptional regulator [Tamaricihabitans halophyticus]
MPNESLSSVQRAIAVLEALGSPEGPAGTGVVEIARHLGREKTQVSRTLQVLSEAGFVERDPKTLEYQLGWRLYTLAAGASDRKLIAAAPSVLRKLVGLVSERSHLSVRNANEALTVLSENPLRSVQAAGWIGRTTPMHCTSTGRALLFDAADDEALELFNASASMIAGPKAAHTEREFLNRLRRARKLGFALADEEFEAGLVAAAAPVRDFTGRIVAAVNVSAPKYRVGRALPNIGRAVAETARELTERLHGTG